MTATLLTGCAGAGYPDVKLAAGTHLVELAAVALWTPSLAEEVDAWLESIQQAPYYHWSSRSDSLAAPFNACSPNLSAIYNDAHAGRGASSLGCHVQRTVSGSSTLSSHAWGAAHDISFPSRQATIEAMDFYVQWSAELGINTIHDYVTQRMWKPAGVGWVSASIGSVGGTWIHVETTPTAFLDGRSVFSRIVGSAPPPPPPAPAPPPTDPAALDVARATWQS